MTHCVDRHHQEQPLVSRMGVAMVSFSMVTLYLSGTVLCVRALVGRGGGAREPIWANYNDVTLLIDRTVDIQFELFELY